MKKNIKVAIIGAFILFSTISTTFAQHEQTIVGSSGWGFSGAWGGWSFNLGQFDKQSAGYNGGVWALEFGKKLYVGGLHYTINNAPLPNSSVNTFTMRSDNLLIGYTPISYRPIHPVISCAIGSGKITTLEGTQNSLVVQPAVGMELNVTRWCHVDAQVGYRAVTNSNFHAYENKDFSGLYGQLNLKFGFSWGRYKTREYNDN